MIRVAGLPYDVRILNSSLGDFDRLTVRGNEGNDTIKSVNPTGGAVNVENIFNITLAGGGGDDFLSADAILIGGIGDDFLEGGAFEDQIFGNEGEDTMIGRGGQDNYDGGPDFDTILVRGTSGADAIDVRQSGGQNGGVAGTLEYVVVNQFNVQVENATVAAGTQDNILNVEEVRVEAGAGSDTIRLAILDALHVDAVVVPNSLRMTVFGGDDQAEDRLGIIDHTDAAVGALADVSILRQNAGITAGTVEIGPGIPGAVANGEAFLHVFSGIEFVQVLADGLTPDATAPINIETPGLLNRLVVFKHDAYEHNNDLNNATHLGANSSINLDPKIDPGPGLFGFPADSDWYRVEALVTGTLDFQAFFEEVAQLANGRAGLPGNGNLDIFLYDVDGTFIAGNGVGGDGIVASNFSGVNFGDNDGGNGGTGELNVDADAFFENERIRVPVVQGQIYYLRVVGVAAAVNNYNVTIINSAPPVPYDIELDDNLGFGDALAGGTAITFSSTSRPGTSGLSPINGYYVGKEITFTTGALDTESAVVTAYTFLAGVGTFTVTPGFSAAPLAGADFQVDAVDTGRSQFDDVTRDNTPTIFFRLDDGYLLNDLPGNPVTDTPPDEVIPIPFRVPSLGTSVLTLMSQPGDFIGQGINQTFTSFDGTFTAFVNFDGGVSVIFVSPQHSFSLDFAPPQGTPFTAGAYNNATRFPFQAANEPGLSVSGDGRGCNTLTGRFDVVEVVFGPGGEVARFVANFEQHCEGAAPALFGQIQFLVPGIQVAPGYTLAVFDEGPGTVGATPPQTPLGFALNAGDINNNGAIDGLEAFVPGVYKFTTPLLTDGSHFLSARVQMIDPALPQQTGFGARSVSLEIVVDTVEPEVSFGDPVTVGDGLLPDSDSGVSPPNTDTIIDLITNDTSPSFWGRAEADAIIRLYVDINGNGTFEQNLDLFIGQDTAIPLDGTNQEPHGYWQIHSVINFNDPDFFPLDGIRTVFIVAEDLAGNINLPGFLDVQQTLQIFIDTQGPQVTSVVITDNPGTAVDETLFDLFNPKPVGLDQGPTPLVNSITISFRDLPARVLPFLYPALKADTVITDHFQLIGDQSGRIAIAQVILVQNPMPVGIATATVTLVFFEPLPDDRFTLIITDSVTDPVGNALDGETNAAEPQENPRFPSGDGIPGGDFVARFTVDTRPELGVYAGIRAYIDLNGNFVFDPTGEDNDAVNRDIVFRFGSTSDSIFAGRLLDPRLAVPPTPAGGIFFDQIAAYGNILGSFRWLFDFNSDGVADFVTTQAVQINGVPVAGNFDGNLANGDEIGLFDGVILFRDLNRNFIIDAGEGAVAMPFGGFPVIGDFDGNGVDDFAAFRNQEDTYRVDFNINGTLDASIVTSHTGTGLGFPGVSERPVAADMNRDGIDDFGIFVPGNLGQVPNESSEFFFLVSQAPAVAGTLSAFADFGFRPVPFGNELFALFGDEPAFPLVGNFDPPLTSVAPPAPPSNEIIVVASGVGTEPRVQVLDRNSGEVRLDFLAYGAGFTGGVRVATGDVNGDGFLDIITAPGAGGGPHIRVFDGVSGDELMGFLAYGSGFTGGVFVATADLNDDGQADIITSAGAGGGPHVKVFNGANGQMLGQFLAYGAGFTGGVQVAAGDVNGDGQPDIVTAPGAGGGPHVRVFDGGTLANLTGPTGNFLAYGAGFTGGVFVAVGDLNGDGRSDIVTGAGAGGGPHVRAFSGLNGTELASFLAYGAAFTGGVRVATGDLDGDSRADIITSPGVGGGPHVRAFDGDVSNGTAVLANFLAINPASTGGIFVAGGSGGAGQALVASSLGSGGGSLEQQQLDSLVAAAIANWESAGASSASLRRARVQIADLPGNTLGLAYPDLVLIDSDAAGHGWFVDSTPETSDDLDSSKIDLLSVIEHELGHVLGLDHDDMASELATGVRHTADDVDAAFAAW